MRSPKDNSFLERSAAPGDARAKTQALIGAVEWFPPGEQDRVEDVLADLQELEISELRTAISWSDCQSPGGPEWYAWLLPRLGRQVNVLPCLVHTSIAAMEGNDSALPRCDATQYPDFVETIVERFGEWFDHVELWSTSADSNALPDVDVNGFPDMIRKAAECAHSHGKKTVLAGTSSSNLSWLKLMCRHGALSHIDVVGVHGGPGQDSHWEGWRQATDRVQAVLDQHRVTAKIWITETGYSTAQHAPYQQIQAFLAAIETPVERVYWFRMRDVDRDACSNNGTYVDERRFHFGLKTASGEHKLLSRMWSNQGIEGLYRLQRSARRLPQPAQRNYTLITGGAGFIGSNLANRLMGAGRRVMIFDNLSRPGVERNLEWLHSRHGDRLIVEIADIRNARAIQRAVQNADQAFDFSAQVAVTTSLINPIHDFEVNARGTLNLLEAIRATGRPIPMVFTSTNKVYGSLDDIRLRAFGDRYEPVSRCLRMQGVDEQRPLDFHSPYGCSKGAADQYVLDYARTLGLHAVVFRMSCIYGPRQFGTEDQGWVAHFLIQAMRDMPVTLYGDGRQVRDILFIEDLLDAFELAQANMARLSGQAFNIGGGPPRTVSLLELIHLIQELTGEPFVARYEDWRPADQKYYVSNTLRFQRATGWGPRVGVEEGVRRLYEWLCSFHSPSGTAASQHAVVH